MTIYDPTRQCIYIQLHTTYNDNGVHTYKDKHNTFKYNAIPDTTCQYSIIRYTARHGNARQYNTRQHNTNKTCQHMAIQDWAGQDRPRQGKARQANKRQRVDAMLAVGLRTSSFYSRVVHSYSQCDAAHEWRRQSVVDQNDFRRKSASAHPCTGPAQHVWAHVLRSRPDQGTSSGLRPPAEDASMDRTITTITRQVQLKCF